MAPGGGAGERPAARRRTGEPEPRISVVIPTYQRRDLAVSAVRALAAQDYGSAFEVIVVVDGSTDGTAESLRRLETPMPLIVIEQPNRGQAAARNRGARAARGRYLLFLDDDMEAHPRLLAEHEGSHTDERTVVLGDIPLHPGSPVSFLATGVGGWARQRSERLSAPGVEISTSDLLTGQMSVRRDLYEAAGGFDERFTHGGSYGDEDLDLGLRLAAAGCRIVFNPDAISYQRYVVTPRQYLVQWRHAGRADVAFARKHPAAAQELFASHGTWTRGFRFVWRPVLRVPGLGWALARVMRPTMLSVAERRPDLPLMRFFKPLRNLEYWRGVREAGGIPRRRPAVVLAYHAIRDVPDPVLGRYAVPPERFAGQLRMLRRAGFRFISASELLSAVRGEGGLPRPTPAHHVRRLLRRPAHGRAADPRAVPRARARICRQRSRGRDERLGSGH